MSSIKEWVVQVRYPYTAGIIAVMWGGTAITIAIGQFQDVNVVIALLSLATLFVALTGFSPQR